MFPELLSKTYIKKLTLRGQSFEGNTALRDECREILDPITLGILTDMIS